MYMNSTTRSAAGARIASLLEPGSFVEIGAAVTARSTDFNLSEKKKPSDGVITGYGMIRENLVYVFSQDSSVLNGTLGEMHAKKIERILEMAQKMGAPVVGMLDSAGMRLEEATDALNAFGQIYKAMSNLSGVVPIITMICGTCGGGMSLIPGMSDFTYMVDGKSELFLNPPNALAGNHASKCDTASATYASEKTGTVEKVASEEEAIDRIRKLLTILPQNNMDPAYDALTEDDPNRMIADAAQCVTDPALLLPRLSDDAAYLEIRPEFGADTVTAFISLGGTTIGAIGNRAIRFQEDGTAGESFDGCMSSKGARKAAEFVRFCDAFSLPIVTLTNVEGFSASRYEEAHNTMAIASLVAAFTTATVPKINVITGKAFGTAGLVMNSRFIGADLVYAWNSAKIGMMDAKQAAKLMFDTTDAAVLREKAKEYDALQNSVESAAARGYVDTVIEPEQTRQYLIGAIMMLYTKREFRPDKKHGTI
jgi:acetyl-CoA carboxylase carboxyltransferase component